MKSHHLIVGVLSAAVTLGPNTSPAGACVLAAPTAGLFVFQQCFKSANIGSGVKG